ncbi:MAG: glutathione S-transferase family protein [Pseudomonadota bacterium]
MLQIYGLPISTYTAKVRIALGLKGVNYEMVPPPGGYSSPSYKAIVPLGTMPGLKHGEFVISESDVLIEYIDETQPGPKILPGGPAERARHRLLARYHDLWLEPHLRRSFAHVNPTARKDEVLSPLLDRFQERLTKLEDLVEPAPYFVGSEIGLGDIAFPPTLTLAEILLPLFGRDVRYGPKMTAWKKAIYANPVVKAVTDEGRQATLNWLNAGSD